MVGLSERINSPTIKSLEATRPTPAPSTWVTLYAGDMIRGQLRIKENNCWGQTILPGGNRCRFLHLEYMPMRRAAQTHRLSQNFKGEKYCHSQWRRSLACTWLFTEQSSIKHILRCQCMFAIQNFCQVHLYRNEWLYSMVQGRLGENK